MAPKFTVAIDGPAAAGKGTISKAVAHTFGFAHLDTGLLYRGVGKKTLAITADELTTSEAVKMAQNLTPADLADPDLRTAEVAQAASRIATIPEVREVLLSFQRDFASREGGAVLDGRDIGTVICPDADVKLFITASAKVRAERRYLELSAKDQNITRANVLEDVIARDKRDRERATAPLIAADDAITIDTSTMSIDDAIKAACTAVDQVSNKT